MSQAQANRTIDPFYTFAKSLTSEGLDIELASTTPFESFYSWHTQLYSSDEQVGGITEMASRLIPRDVIESNYEGVADAFIGLSDAYWVFVGGGAVSRVNQDSTGLNPAWRRALAHVIFWTTWDEGTPTGRIAQLRKQLAQNLKNISDVTPGSGAYFNEASMFEPNPSYTFFGLHYEKLKRIKKIYDPTGLFIVTEGVGSDDWDQSLNCRR